MLVSNNISRCTCVSDCGLVCACSTADVFLSRQSAGQGMTTERRVTLACMYLLVITLLGLSCKLY